MSHKSEDLCQMSGDDLMCAYSVFIKEWNKNSDCSTESEKIIKD